MEYLNSSGSRNIIIGAGILLIFILFCRYAEDSFIEGFWKADASFCSQAEVLNYVVYFGPGTFTRRCYFIAMNEAGLFLNHPVDTSFGPSMNFKPWLSHQVDRNVSVEFVTEPPEEDVLPSNFVLTYYPLAQKMVLHDNDTVIAVLYKDTTLSAQTYSTMPEQLIEQDDEPASRQAQQDGCDSDSESEPNNQAE